jgi:hypothetical protein
VRLQPLLSPEGTDASALEAERRSWFALWLPAAPVVGVLIGLIGWAVVEPENAERLSVSFYFLSAPVLFVAFRALVRAVRSAAACPEPPLAATVGLLRPRVVLSERLREALDLPAFEAARHHEMAHAAHYDPLRIWLARFAADLRWPGKTARRHYLIWRECLEIARDEEVVRSGTDGTDLAAAILATARLSSCLGRLAAGLLDPAYGLERRVRLLLGSAPSTGSESRRSVLTLLLVASLGLSVAVGAGIGEFVLERFFLT